VVLREDNLGLGARTGGAAAGECTGLDAFQMLLGRLNGKADDELEKEQRKRDDLRRAIYTEQKWGSIRFVRGGVLVGDKIQELITKEEDRVRALSNTASKTEAEVEDTTPNQESPDEAHEDASEQKKLKKKEKKDKKRRLQEEDDSSTSTPAELDEDSTKEKKSKKEKRKKAKDGADETLSSAPVTDGEEAKKKKEKKDKKDKKERKEKKAKKRKAAESSESDSEPEASSEAATTTTSIANSGTSTPLSMTGGRHHVRARWIAQKRAAVMDTAALNQVSHADPRYACACQPC
jgi:Pin2-interacting protein X1